MAKSRAHKLHTSKKSASTTRILFIIAILLISIGMLMFAVQNKNTAEVAQAPVETVASVNGADIGPNRGCELIDTNYVCEIKVKNPSENVLNWSVIIDGIEGASVSEEKGTLAANDDSMIQLTVPQVFCVNNPDTQGNITVVDDIEFTNQAKTTFNCAFLEQ